MGSKTPVSVLQELMMRRSLTPQYELVEDGTGTHDPVFKYKVIAGPVCAIGVGRAKKEAKHDAARRALVRLGEDEPNVTDIESPYKDKTQENSVGALLDFCAVHNLPAPDFLLVSDTGPPHAKQFTIACKVSKNQRVATGRTKKQAKQLAAQKLLTKLKESLGEFPLDDVSNKKEKISEEELLKKLELLGKAMINSNTKSCGYRLPEAIHLLRDVACETLDKIRNNDQDPNIGSYNLIVSIGNELNADVTTEIIPCVDTNMISAVVKIDLALPSCEYGVGKNEQEAIDNACADLIRFLLFMTS